MNILVCDDDSSRGETVNDHIRSAGRAVSAALTGADLTQALRSLFVAIKSFRTSGAEDHRRWDFTQYAPIRSPFDEADVLFLDNNLTLLDTDGPPLTAESIAGYLRAFTDARYIVSLNMNPDVDFDLRYLIGDFQSRADLAINADHLENRYLWTGDPRDSATGFAPSYWPQLGSIAAYRIRQVEFVQANFNNSVLESLSFDDEAISMLSRHAQGALSPEASLEMDGPREGRPLRDITFRDFFLAKSRALPVQEERDQLDAVYERNESVQRVVARVVAADIDLWLRRDVIGPQEPLVDVPHLTGRLPFLLGDSADQLESWNGVVTNTEPPFGWDPQMYEDLVSSKRFEHEKVWTQKPCFWWSKLNDDERVNTHLRASRGQDWADAVFCEDTSRFQFRDDGQSIPMEFVTEFEGVWNRRHIAKLGHVQYAPLTRLAL